MIAEVPIHGTHFVDKTIDENPSLEPLLRELSTLVFIGNAGELGVIKEAGIALAHARRERDRCAHELVGDHDSSR